MLYYRAVLGREQPLVNEINFGMNHAPGAGSMAEPADFSSAHYHWAMAALC